jgi:hypothetical protein
MRIDAGTLGSTASDLEESLHAVFRMADKWGAITLLDEADVFLEQRGHSDMERNRLIAGENTIHLHCNPIYCQTSINDQRLIETLATGMQYSSGRLNISLASSFSPPTEFSHLTTPSSPGSIWGSSIPRWALAAAARSGKISFHGRERMRTHSSSIPTFPARPMMTDSMGARSRTPCR